MNWWSICTVFFALFFLVSYLKSIQVNHRVLKDKKRTSGLKKAMLILCGPWGTLQVNALEDREPNEEEKVINLYKKLKKRFWFEDKNMLMWIVSELKKENLKKDQLIRLRAFINIAELKRLDIVNVISLLVSLVMAAFIGIATVKLSQINIVQIIDDFFTVTLLIIFIYIMIIILIRRAKTKISIVKEGLDTYIKLTETEKQG